MNFKTTEEIGKILPALIKTQAEIPPMGKDKKNPHSKSEYLTLDKISSIVYPIANKNNIFISQLPVEKKTEEGQSIGVDTILWHSSGEYVLYPAVYYEFEKGGRMNLTQSVGSIITYSKRYALTSIFGISTNEDDDGVGQPAPQKAEQPTKRERKWQEFVKNRDELFERVKDLATESMQSTTAVNEVMLKRTGAEIGEDQESITPENFAIYNKHLRAAEVKFSAHQAEAEKEEPAGEQGSILLGNTTTAAEGK